MPSLRIWSVILTSSCAVADPQRHSLIHRARRAELQFEGTLEVQSCTDPTDDPRQERADRMVQNFNDLIQRLGVTTLSCCEGEEFLHGFQQSQSPPWVINAMEPFVGPRAKACRLRFSESQEQHGWAMQEHPPSSHQDHCVLYCGESDCPAALTYMKNAEQKLKANCGQITYLQGGALCFLDRSVDVVNRDQCMSIVAPHNAAELDTLASQMSVTKRQCDALSESELSDSYVLNMMIPVFGQRAASCNLAQAGTVHGEAPSTLQDKCVLYCGEASCPFAVTFLQSHKKDLMNMCSSITFLEGGAACFLEKGMQVQDESVCRGIVAPESA